MLDWCCVERGTSKPQKVHDLTAMASGEVKSKQGKLQQVMTATKPANAGISFKSCPVVVHCCTTPHKKGPPSSLEVAVQQMGWAGHDGLPAAHLASSFTLNNVKNLIVQGWKGCVESAVSTRDLAAAKEALRLQKACFNILRVLFLLELVCAIVLSNLILKVQARQTQNQRFHTLANATRAEHGAQPENHTSAYL
jgi:hypothetical protein